MNAFTLMILLGFISLCRTDCVINHRTRSEEWEKKLNDDLKCKWHEKPNKNNITEVKMWFLLKYFNLNEDDEFYMSSWTNLEWVDERLAWDPSKYGGLAVTEFNGWTPLWVVNNALEDLYQYIDQCNIKSVGTVFCMTKISDSAQCVTKLTNWPYDTQRCTLEYGVSAGEKNVHLIISGKRAVTITDKAEYGPEWTIVEYEQENNVSDTTQLKITFVMERNGECLGAIVIFPSILLFFLIASSVLLDVNDSKRLWMMMFLVICHCFYLSEIAWNIPKLSTETPTILLFYRFSIVFNAGLMVLTVLLMRIRNRASVPPSWVSTVSTKVLGSHGNYFLWPRWETDSGLTLNSVNAKDLEAWNVLANIINSASFFITVFVYSIIMPVLIPKSQGLAQKLKPDSFLYGE